jgi:hypothetical protein
MEQKQNRKMIDVVFYNAEENNIIICSAYKNGKTYWVFASPMTAENDDYIICLGVL